MSNRLHLWGLALFFFSGFTGLVYEVLWTRRLGLTFGHSTLAISTVVTAYMGGLALGVIMEDAGPIPVGKGGGHI